MNLSNWRSKSYNSFIELEKCSLNDAKVYAKLMLFNLNIKRSDIHTRNELFRIIERLPSSVFPIEDIPFNGYNKITILNNHPFAALATCRIEIDLPIEAESPDCSLTYYYGGNPPKSTRLYSNVYRKGDENIIPEGPRGEDVTEEILPQFKKFSECNFGMFSNHESDQKKSKSSQNIEYTPLLDKSRDAESSEKDNDTNIISTIIISDDDLSQSSKVDDISSIITISDDEMEKASNGDELCSEIVEGYYEWDPTQDDLLQNIMSEQPSNYHVIIVPKRHDYKSGTSASPPKVSDTTTEQPSAMCSTQKYSRAKNIKEPNHKSCSGYSIPSKRRKTE